VWREAKNDGEDGPLLCVEEVCTPFERGKWQEGDMIDLAVTNRGRRDYCWLLV
jgi:hypothetical protein